MLPELNTTSGKKCSEYGFIKSGSSIKGWKPIRIQGFDKQKLDKKAAEKKGFFDQKLQFIYHQTFTKDVQDTGEAFSPQKRTPEPQNKKFLIFFC